MYQTSVNFIKLLLFCLLLTLSSHWAYSQVQNQQAEYLNWFDQQLGIENTSLMNGVIYREFYRTINDNVKFFSTDQWFTGSVHYSGQWFYDVPLKYDVFGDQLIIRQPDRLGGGALILYKEHVRQFLLYDAVFVRINPESNELVKPGYYELLAARDELRMLVKYRKKEFLRKDRKRAYHEFIDAKKTYVLNHASHYYPIKVKKDLVKIFPDYKEALNSFYQDNKRLQNRNPDRFMILLTDQLASLLNSNQPNSTP